MAKWGEGDPRWIVEQRPDAHNVNNWHWCERDATSWSKSKLKELLKGLEVVGSAGACSIAELTSCDGEASVSNRKKKIICFYEFVIKATWKGSLKNGDIVYSGNLEIPNFSEEQDMDDVDVNVSFGKDQQKCDALKELMRVNGANVIRDKLSVFQKLLREECAAAIQVPTNDNQNKLSAATTAAPIAASFKQSVNLTSSERPVANASKNSVGTKIHTKKLVMTEVFMTDVAELYKCLTEKGLVEAWSRGKVAGDARAKESFEMFGGNVSGDYVQLLKDSKIVMRWRLKNWPDAHFSTATLTFLQTASGAQIKLEQTGVPQEAVETTQAGWRRYYWTPIRMTFGYGTNIF